MGRERIHKDLQLISDSNYSSNTLSDESSESLRVISGSEEEDYLTHQVSPLHPVRHPQVTNLRILYQGLRPRTHLTNVERDYLDLYQDLEDEGRFSASPLSLYMGLGAWSLVAALALGCFRMHY